MFYGHCISQRQLCVLCSFGSTSCASLEICIRVGAIFLSGVPGDKAKSLSRMKYHGRYRMGGIADTGIMKAIAESWGFGF